jgi:hypothetical protein
MPNQASPAAVGPDGTIYVSSGFYEQGNEFFACTLNAIDQTGKQLWMIKTNRLWGSPSVGKDGSVYICDDNGVVYSYTSKGALNWKTTVYGVGLLPSPAIGNDGTLYFGGTGLFTIK